ncbi:MAG: ribosome maturation factor RimP [Acidimicrobiia bacterium]|nr:ribosome maturation factor RimP [Acidimicrobiia bacterium]
MSDGQQSTDEHGDTVNSASAEQGRVRFGSPVTDKVYDILAPVIATVDAELIDVEWLGGTLRLVVDAEGGVTTERLADVNRLVSPLLDQHDPVPGRYLLEVSSPGVERPLRRVGHYRRAVGEQVIVKLETWSEIRRVRGELLAADDDAITVLAVETDGVDLAEPTSMNIAHRDIAKARTHFAWGPTPKPGGKSAKKPSGSGKGKKKSGQRKKKSGR